MPLVIDAYNVVHVTGVLPPGLAGMDVPELVRVIPRTRFGGDRAVLVCDGLPAGGGPRVEGAGRVKVTYAGGGKSADDLIAAMVQRSSAPRSLTVVSSDREVQRAARRRRCPVLTSEDFLRRIADDLHGEYLDALAEAESPPPAAPPGAPPAGATGATAPSGRRRPRADPLFPAELIREAAAFELPPEPGAPDAEAAAADRPDVGGTPAAPAPPTEPPSASPAESPPRAPATDRAAEPLFSADLLAEALDLARDDADRREQDAARRRADRTRREAIDAAGAAEAARLRAEQDARDAAARAGREARDRRLADEASSAIDDRELAALDELLRRTVPPEDLPRKDETFDQDILAEAERMLRDFGEEPRGR